MVSKLASLIRHAFAYAFLLLLLPAVLAAVIVWLLFIIPFGVSWGWFERARWLRDLRRQGRAMPAATLLAENPSGTLIVDRPGFKLNGGNCWWTGDDIAELSPFLIPTDDGRLRQLEQTKGSSPLEFDKWCWERYISPTSGAAVLVTPARRGDVIAMKLRKRLPQLALVTSWSAVGHPIPHNETNGALMS